MGDGCFVFCLGSVASVFIVFDVFGCCGGALIVISGVFVALFGCACFLELGAWLVCFSGVCDCFGGF